jgi:hypothetical protein
MTRYVILISKGKCRLGGLVLIPSIKEGQRRYAMSRTDGRQTIAGKAPFFYPAGERPHHTGVTNIGSPAKKARYPG